MEENKVATKADERAALTKIKKIVEGLGANSYLATAFDGVFGIADQNIEFDAAFSAKFYIEEYNNASERERKLKERYDRELDDRNRTIEDLSEKLRTTEFLSSLRIQECWDLKEQIAKMRNDRDDRISRAERKLKEARLKILKLKSQIYYLVQARKREGN